MTLNGKDEQRLLSFLDELKVKNETFIGYPVNTSFDYSAILPFLNFSINNVGDPFDSSYYGLNSESLRSRF